ncbi:hypothetical protein CMO92_01395 [Candidatus Woesearchaeota archaeon]|nr:hypothetical protein [Candidatus Woesearchaeota archaeon]|tara:strand:+ start:577 stop:963 length:387 start_codon:yes stop_codon:yes gene_type:complete
MKIVLIFVLIATVLLGLLAYITSNVIPTASVVQQQESNFAPIVGAFPTIHLSSQQGRMIDLKKYVHDPEGDPLSVAFSQSPNLNLVLLNDGNLVLDPVLDFEGETSFAIIVSDGTYEAISDPIQVIVK